MAKIVTIIVLVALWKATLAHSGSVVGGIGAVTAWGFGVATNSDSNALEYVFKTGVFYLCAAWIVGLFLSLVPGQGGEIGKNLRSIPKFVFRLLLRWLPRGAAFLWKGLIRLSGLDGHKPASPITKPKEKTGKGEDRF